MASREGARRPWRTLLPFSVGRLCGYALLGSAAGWAGLVVQERIASPWMRWVLGGATVLVALSLLWRTHRPATPRGGTGPSACVVTPGRQTLESSSLLPGSLFVMGLGMALNPCAPLTTVVLAAATTSSALSGLLLGLSFGVGAVLIPSLIFAIGVAHFATQIRVHLGRWRGTLEKVSIGLLFVMGTGTALGWIAL
jgi:sulfite exporter TauE/SafE